jgi:cytidylate kinase
MKSYIPDFQDDYEKKSEIVVCICGPSGAGKGTLGSFVAEELGIDYYSAGDLFRGIAKEKGLSVEELSEKADKQTDVEVDRKTLEKGLNQDCVIDSRIAAWVLGSYSDFNVYVTADLKERAKRMMEDLGNRKNEEGASELEKAKEIIKKRDKDNRERYEEYYGIDMSNREIFDMVVDNTDMSIEKQEELVGKAVRKRFGDKL